VGTRLLYDRKAAAEQLSLGISSLDYFIARRSFPNIRRIGTKILIPHADLVRFARADHPGPVKGPPQAKPEALPLAA
jgi:hypothetical protein